MKLSLSACVSIDQLQSGIGPFYHMYEKWSLSEALISFGSAEHHDLEVSIRPPKTLNTPITKLACMTMQEKNESIERDFKWGKKFNTLPWRDEWEARGSGKN